MPWKVKVYVRTWAFMRRCIKKIVYAAKHDQIPHRKHGPTPNS